MKNILLIFLLLQSSICLFAQETEKDVDCFEYPTNDAILDAAINNVATNSLQFKKLFINFFNTLSRPEQAVLGTALNSNNPLVLQQYPLLNDPKIADLVGSVIGQYQLAWARQKELYPHADSATNIENLNKTIICCMDKLSLNSNNELAKVDVDCEKIRMKCENNVDKDYFRCLFWSGVGGFFSTLVGTPAAGIATFATGISKCAYYAAIDTKNCQDEYEDCLKRQRNQ